MVILDDLKNELVSYRKDINELSEVLNIENAKKEVNSLHIEMEQQGFWDDLENSQKVVQKSKNLENKIEHFKQLSNKLEDTIAMVELAMEEQD